MLRRSIFFAFLGLLLVLPAKASSNQKKPFVISLPDGKVRVSVDLSGFTIEKNEVQADGRYYLLANQKEPPRNLSIYLERVPGAADLRGCQESVQQKAAIVKAVAQDVRAWESGKTALLELMINEFRGMPVHQKNLFACIPSGDTFVDVHISKTLYEPKDEAGIQSLFDSIHVFDASELQIEDDDLREGSKYYMQRNLPKAIERYSKALQREKESPHFNQTTLRVLIDNLGMAYGMSGDLQDAKETFEYGVGRDGQYPLFHYNLACTYAEMGDLKTTEDYLTRAFQYRANVIAGETMPDPREDSSFQKFMQNADFRKFIDDLMAPAK